MKWLGRILGFAAIGLCIGQKDFVLKEVEQYFYGPTVIRSSTISQVPSSQHVPSVPVTVVTIKLKNTGRSAAQELFISNDLQNLIGVRILENGVILREEKPKAYVDLGVLKVGANIEVEFWIRGPVSTNHVFFGYSGSGPQEFQFDRAEHSSRGTYILCGVGLIAVLLLLFMNFRLPPKLEIHPYSRPFPPLLRTP